METRWIDTARGPRCRVFEMGKGAPLVFLHGAGGVPAWEGVLPLLPAYIFKRTQPPVDPQSQDADDGIGQPHDKASLP